MFDNLSNLGYGLVTFAIIIGIGTIVLTKFGGSIAECASGFTYSDTLDKCTNTTTAYDVDPTNSGWVNTNYLAGQLGQSGLAGWTPAIIALSVGMLFLGVFLNRGGRKI